MSNNMTEQDLYSIIEISQEVTTYNSETDIHKKTIGMFDSIIGMSSNVYVDLFEKKQKACDCKWANHQGALLGEWLENYQHEDPFFQTCLSQSKLYSNYVFNSVELTNLNNHKYLNSQFYNEFMVPNSFYHMLTIGLPSSTGKLISAISLQRSKNDKPFSTKDSIKANMIAPLIGSLVERISLSKEVKHNPDANSLPNRDQKSEILPERLQEFSLSKREIEIIELVHKGLTNIEIAKLFGLSARTVSNHLHSIYTKTEVHNRTTLLYQLTT